MALWYECGNGLIKTSFAKKHEFNDAYVICPGPSLADVDPAVFSSRQGYTVAGVTTSYPKIKPDIWVGMDRVECYDRQIWWEPFMKVCRGNYNNMMVEGYEIKNFKNTFFADCKKPTAPEDIFNLRGHDVHFVWNKNTLAVALHLLVWMGFKKFHFVGCDLTKGYFDGRMVGVAREDTNQRLHEELVGYLRWFSVTGRKRGISTLSCGANSRLNDFMDYIPLDAAVKNSERKVKPFMGHPILHAIDAERMYQLPKVIEYDDISDSHLFLED